jgi:hypothetical protein
MAVRDGRFDRSRTQWHALLQGPTQKPWRDVVRLTICAPACNWGIFP